MRTAFAIILLAASTAYGAGSIYTSVIYPGSTVVLTMPYAINDAGTIAGSYEDDSNVFHAFSLSGSTYTSFDYPGSTATFAYGVSSLGTMAGYYQDTSGVDHGFSLVGTTYTPIDYPGATATVAYGVNASGTIVGYFGDATYAYHGFIYSGTTYTPIDYPGSTATFASGINDDGTIVGYYQDATGYHGFSLVGTTYTSLDYPGASFTVPCTISPTGTIVGYYGDASGYQHGFTSSPAFAAFPDYPGALFTIPNGMNSSGQVVGNWGDGSWTTHPILATPDPNVINGTCGPSNGGPSLPHPRTSAAQAALLPFRARGPGLDMPRLGGRGDNLLPGLLFSGQSRCQPHRYGYHHERALRHLLQPHVLVFLLSRLCRAGGDPFIGLCLYLLEGLPLCGRKCLRSGRDGEPGGEGHLHAHTLTGHRLHIPSLRKGGKHGDHQGQELRHLPGKLYRDLQRGSGYCCLCLDGYSHYLHRA